MKPNPMLYRNLLAMDTGQLRFGGCSDAIHRGRSVIRPHLVDNGKDPICQSKTRTNCFGGSRFQRSKPGSRVHGSAF